jgi:hypothetical protein
VADERREWPTLDCVVMVGYSVQALNQRLASDSAMRQHFLMPLGRVACSSPLLMAA